MNLSQVFSIWIDRDSNSRQFASLSILQTIFVIPHLFRRSTCHVIKAWVGAHWEGAAWYILSTILDTNLVGFTHKRRNIGDLMLSRSNFPNGRLFATSSIFQIHFKRCRSSPRTVHSEGGWLSWHHFPFFQARPISLHLGRVSLA